VTGYPKVAAEDTSIVASNSNGEKKAIPILKGSGILINVVGTHYNRTYLVFTCLVLLFILMMFFQKKITFSARYWDDPHTFDPSRFLKDWPREAFLPFSAGENFSFLLKSVFLITKISRSPCVHRTKVFGSHTFPIESFLKSPSFFYIRFAETESTAVLTMLISQYKITIKEEPQFAGETFEERKSRILSAQQGLTLM
jgi:hypothetical protein